MAQQGPGVWPNSTSKDSTRRSASSEETRAKLHDVGCHIIHKACCEAGLTSQREVVVPALVTEKLTEPRVDVGAWGHPGLPHMRLDFTGRRCRSSPLLLGHEKSAGIGAECSTSRESEGEQIRKKRKEEQESRA